jgi:hypothetical protein
MYIRLVRNVLDAAVDAYANDEGLTVP